MSQTTTAPPPERTAPMPIHPSDILIAMIVAFLAPMFLSASNGDISFARLAALETVNAYRARTQVDLLIIAQIIAFGLGALGSMSLSMLDDLPPKLILRFRGNATACHRCAEQSQRTLAAQPEPKPAKPTQAEAAQQAANEAEVAAQVAATEKRVAAHQAAQRTPRPTPAQAVPQPQAAPAAPPATPSDAAYQSAWANAMSTVAAEYLADTAHLSPAEREQASRRASALSACANQLLSGQPTQPRRPGDRDTAAPPVR